MAFFVSVVVVLSLCFVSLSSKKLQLFTWPSSTMSFLQVWVSACLFAKIKFLPCLLLINIKFPPLFVNIKFPPT